MTLPPLLPRGRLFNVSLGNVFSFSTSQLLWVTVHSFHLLVEEDALSSSRSTSPLVSLISSSLLYFLSSLLSFLHAPSFPCTYAIRLFQRFCDVHFFIIIIPKIKMYLVIDGVWKLTGSVCPPSLVHKIKVCLIIKAFSDLMEHGYCWDRQVLFQQLQGHYTSL